MLLFPPEVGIPQVTTEAGFREGRKSRRRRSTWNTTRATAVKIALAILPHRINLPVRNYLGKLESPWLPSDDEEEVELLEVEETKSTTRYTDRGLSLQRKVHKNSAETQVSAGPG